MRIYNKKAGRWVQVFSAPANFGANGLGDGTKRTEGDLQTPTGIWHIGSFLFGQHGSAPSGTKMRYRAITSHSWWSCQRDSTYNTWVESASHVSGEHLANATVQYEYAFDSGYNSLPNKRVMGRGTAIFIHCFEPAGNSLGPNTHGCVALSRADMRRVFGLLDPARHPSCSVGTLAAGTSTSIYAY
jgi:L,D-peptidoglycan transpeptidase YkuD (ErfK/YbiS/YcfS/YnhG family)